jgi:hypothetical protein
MNALPNIISVIKSKKMRWAEQAGRVGDMRGAYNFLFLGLKI